MMSFRQTLPFVLAALAAGCVNLAPQYQRPEAPIPASLPGEGAASGIPAQTDWQQFIQSGRLRQSIALALENNRDLRVAVQNIEVARAQYRIQRADLLPQVAATGALTRQRTPASTSSSGVADTSSTYTAELGVSSYTLDLFGRVRNLGEAALQSYLALEDTRRSVQISLIAETATAWLTLAADQQQLRLAQDTLQSRSQSYELQRQAQALGGASGLTVEQARGNYESARQSVASYTSQVRQDRNALELLVGATLPQELLPEDDADWLSGAPASASGLVEVPAGLPSSVLLQRPDILAAERTLLVDNANIGAARAQFFPSITLTAAAGSSSRSLQDLFGAGTGAWSFSPAISLPIFNAGALRAELDAARAQYQADLASYEKTIQTAFREVADALAARGTLHAQLDALQAQVDAAKNSLELSQAAQRHGYSSHLDVLDAQRSLYSAQQSLISLRLTEQVNRVTLYQALGGTGATL